MSFSSQKRGSRSSESPPLYVTHPQEENEEERSKGEKRSLVFSKESLVMKKERVSQQVWLQNEWEKLREVLYSNNKDTGNKRG